MKKLRKWRICLFLVVVLSISNIASAATAKNEDEFVEQLYSNLLNRNKDVEIVYVGDDAREVVDNFNDYLTKAFLIDKKSTTSDSDYLVGIYHGYRLNYSERSVFENSKMNVTATFKLSFDYHETKKQTQKVDEQIKKIMKSLDIDKLTDYGKVKAIHDYIVNRIDYDTSCSEYSAYSGLINKTTVCNGYALLFYKMVKQAGVPCRYVTGYGKKDGKKVNHAWNIVKLNGKWYNVDSTWDDPIGGTRVYYSYFLKGSTKFNKDHIPQDELGTQNFVQTYKFSKNDYKVTEDDIKMANKLSVEVGKSKKVVLPVPEGTKVRWNSSKSSVATVNSSGKIVTKKLGSTTISAKLTLPDNTMKTLKCKVSVTD